MLSLPQPEAQTSLDALNGVGPVRLQQLNKLGLDNYSDLLFHLPFRYEDWRPETDPQRLLSRDEAALCGDVTRVRRLRGSPQRTMVEIRTDMRDETVRARAVIFGRRFLHRRLSPGQRVSLWGSWERDSSGTLQCVGANLDEGAGRGIIPVYPATGGLSSKRIGGFVEQVCQSLLDSIAPVLPGCVLDDHDLLPLPDAIRAVHFPQSHQQIQRARRSLAFVEMVVFQLSLELSRRQWVNAPAFSQQTEGELVDALLDRLPFDLTLSQREAVQQIRQDMSKNAPMYRLLQGDVGSGKTIVGIVATLICVECGNRAAWLIPTRILAQQHYRTLKSYLKPLGISVECVTGESSHTESVSTDSGGVDVVVGTHALLGKPETFRSLGFLLIDEQQRFGVRQREHLQKISPRPDVLMLSATPIPRTLARTVYGGLQVGTLTEIPAGGRKTETKIVSRQQRQKVYKFVKKCTKRGLGAFVVCPEIDASGSQDELTSAESWIEHLRGWLSDVRFALIHGRIEHERRECILKQFARGDIDVLVGTTVVGVGIDIPRAAVMVVEDAAQFGLSELHQLRGRIGRAGQSSYCFLIERRDNSERAQKLRVLQESSDGMEIAREDLRRRGMGSFFSVQQHGLPPFVLSEQLQDCELRKDVVKTVSWLMENDAVEENMTDMAQHIYGDSLITAQVR